MAKLSPSILSADFARLGEDCQEVLAAGADMIHFDVMDGQFVNNISFGLPVLKALRNSLPDAYFDVHLMITHPLAYVEAFLEAGANCISFHVEAADDIRTTLAKIHALGGKAGLVINPETPVEAVFPYLKNADLILTMGVTPGQGGQPFRPETLEKLKKLSAECSRENLTPELSVDGGITAYTGAQCVEAGATLLVAGSAIFGAEDRAAAVRAFQNV